MNTSFDKEAQNTHTKKTTSSMYVSGQAEWFNIIEFKWNNFITLYKTEVRMDEGQQYSSRYSESNKEKCGIILNSLTQEKTF